jgi:hypothetical protein
LASLDILICNQSVDAEVDLVSNSLGRNNHSKESLQDEDLQIDEDSQIDEDESHQGEDSDRSYGYPPLQSQYPIGDPLGQLYVSLLANRLINFQLH